MLVSLGKRPASEREARDWGSLTNTAVIIALQRKTALGSWVKPYRVSRSDTYAAQVHPSTALAL